MAKKQKTSDVYLLRNFIVVCKLQLVFYRRSQWLRAPVQGSKVSQSLRAPVQGSKVSQKLQWGELRRK